MISGTLKKDENGRWEIQYPGGTGKGELTCGDVVEVFAFRDWLPGRIEATTKLGYYFFDPDTDAVLLLHEGLRARIPER